VSAPKTQASVRAQPLTNLLLVGGVVCFCFLLQSLQDYSNIDVSVNGGDGGAFISKDHGASSKNVSSVVGGAKGSIKVSLKKKNKGKMRA
jgi:hypothetical protein